MAELHHAMAHAWLGQGQVGHCGATTRMGDCRLDEKGFWALPSAAWDNWTSAAAACLARCDGCVRCTFVTLSLRFKDCSWYSECSLESLHAQPNVGAPPAAFRSGPPLTASAIATEATHNNSRNSVNRGGEADFDDDHVDMDGDGNIFATKTKRLLNSDGLPDWNTSTVAHPGRPYPK